jgi:hypothetical protein
MMEEKLLFVEDAMPMNSNCEQCWHVGWIACGLFQSAAKCVCATTSAASRVVKARGESTRFLFRELRKCV